MFVKRDESVFFCFCQALYLAYASHTERVKDFSNF